MASRRVRRVAIAVLALAALAVVALAAAATLALQRHTLPELTRYSERRLEGHTKLETLARPFLMLARAQFERDAPPALPTLGKGQQPASLPRQRYDAGGRPLARVSTDGLPAAPPDLLVTTVDELARALDTAKAGQTVELAAGRYALRNTLVTRHAGSRTQPIVVRATVPGAAVIESSAVEAVVVRQPYWTFENLVLRGTCAHEHDCEHAFHVVGAARGTVLRNNRLEDFNAHVKVNGDGDGFPDDGLLQFNTLANRGARRTDAPVTLVDIVAADGWQVADNRIEHFVKGGGDGISYGVFMKGAGRGGRIERNLVLCTRAGVWQPGQRVGVSFGGGSTGASSCRDRRCEQEHFDGLAASNVVAHCNDFGIDVNRSSVTLAHNTLVNTAGIDVRRPPAAATSHGNLLDGRLRARPDTQLWSHDDSAGALARRLQAPDALDLRWRELPVPVATAASAPLDFCGRARGASTLPGAGSGRCGDAADPPARP